MYEILESIDQNQDLLDSVHRWNHTITSDAWQKVTEASVLVPRISTKN